MPHIKITTDLSLSHIGSPEREPYTRTHPSTASHRTLKLSQSAPRDRSNSFANSLATPPGGWASEAETFNGGQSSRSQVSRALPPPPSMLGLGRIPMQAQVTAKVPISSQVQYLLAPQLLFWSKTGSSTQPKVEVQIHAKRNINVLSALSYTNVHVFPNLNR